MNAQRIVLCDLEAGRGVDLGVLFRLVEGAVTGSDPDSCGSEAAEVKAALRQVAVLNRSITEKLVSEKGEARALLQAVRGAKAVLRGLGRSQDDPASFDRTA